MSQSPPVEEPLVGEVRMRVPLPVVIPLGALTVIAVLAIAFSRILLSIPHELATVVAIATAANILAACAFVAQRPRMGAASLIELGAVVLYPVIIGVAIAQLGIGEAAHGGGGAAPAPAPAAESTIVAEGLAFDKDQITLKGKQPVEYTLVNQDTEQHNLAIYTNEEDGLAKRDPLFQGDIIAGGSETTYEIDPPPPGKYYFQCDVHPSMKGTVTAK